MTARTSWCNGARAKPPSVDLETEVERGRLDTEERPLKRTKHGTETIVGRSRSRCRRRSTHRLTCWRGSRNRNRSRSRSRCRLSKRWWHRFREHQLASVTDLPKHSAQATIKRRVVVLISIPEAVPNHDQMPIRQRTLTPIRQREDINQTEDINQRDRTTSVSLR